ncbi:MAG: hypothetical protein K6F07_04140 [Bacilli bacterium]|nr:hypothetical protein [Bacilli bacterium]
MKKILILPILIFPSIVACSSATHHQKAADVFKKYGEKKVSTLGDNVFDYSFEEISKATSEYTTGKSFYYSPKRDAFRLLCYFDSYSSNGVVEGFVYVDFKWGEYQKNFHHFDLIVYDASNNPIHYYAQYDFFLVGINNDELSSQYHCDIIYDEYPSDSSKTIQSAYLLIKDAFNYGKEIIKRYNLSKFY